MKRIVGILLIIVSISGRAESQMAVSIMQEGIGAMVYYLTSAQQYIQMITNSANTIRLQVKALQKLGKGGWDGFIDYFNYQGKALSSFGNVIASYDMAQYFNEGFPKGKNGKVDFKVEKWMQDFKSNVLPKRAMQNGLEEMKNMFHKLENATSNIKMFVKNTEQRMETLSQMREQAEFADTPVKQSELIFQALSLIAAQNEDQIQQIIGENTVLTNKTNYVKKVKEHLLQMGEEKFGLVVKKGKQKIKEFVVPGGESLGTKGRDYERDVKKYAQRILMYKDKWLK